MAPRHARRAQKSLAGLAIGLVVLLIRIGLVGHPVRVPPGLRRTFERDSNGPSGIQKETIMITRANIVVPVATRKVVDFHGKKIGYVQRTSFTDGSGAELRAQVNKVLHQGATSLILDLRENGGGLLDEAVNVASIFIPDGTIVSTDGRSQPRQVYQAKGGAISTKLPVVVLVDRGT